MLGKNPGTKPCSHVWHVQILFPASASGRGEPRLGLRAVFADLALTTPLPPIPGHGRLLPFRDKYFSESRSLKEGTDIVPSLSEHKGRKRVPLWGRGHPSLLAPWWLGPSLLPHPACSHSCSIVAGIQRSTHIQGASLCSSGRLLFPVGGVTFPDSGVFPILRDFSKCVHSSSGVPSVSSLNARRVHLDCCR